MRQGYVGIERIGQDNVPISGWALGWISDEEESGSGGIVVPFIAAPGFHIGQEALISGAVRMLQPPISVSDKCTAVKTFGLKQFFAPERSPVEKVVDGFTAAGEARFERGCCLVVK
jgi:hypothetical protein